MEMKENQIELVEDESSKLVKGQLATLMQSLLVQDVLGDKTLVSGNGGKTELLPTEWLKPYEEPIEDISLEKEIENKNVLISKLINSIFKNLLETDQYNILKEVFETVEDIRDNCKDVYISDCLINMYEENEEIDVEHIYTVTYREVIAYKKKDWEENQDELEEAFKSDCQRGNYDLDDEEITSEEW